MWGTLFTFQCQVFWGIVSLATVETRTARPSLAFSLGWWGRPGSSATLVNKLHQSVNDMAL